MCRLHLCLFLSLIAASACAGGTGGLQLATPVSHQNCTEPGPIDTVAPADLFDEPAILAAVPGQLASDSLIAVFSFSVDSTAHMTEPRLIGGSIGQAQAEPLGSVIVDAFRDWTPEGRRFGARLRIEGGAEPTLAFHSQAGCAPAMTVRSRRRATDHLRSLAGEVDHQTDVMLNLFTDARGRVTEVRLVRSPGNVVVNESLTEFAETLRFHPAIIDGERVPVWVQLPFTLIP